MFGKQWPLDNDYSPHGVTAQGTPFGRETMKRYGRKLLSVLKGDDSPTLVTALHASGGQVLVSVITVAGEELPLREAEVRHYWHAQVLYQCMQGRSPDLGAFPGLVLAARMSAGSPRWTAYCHAYNLAMEAKVVEGYQAPVHALQFAVKSEESFMRFNQDIRGVLWVIPRPGGSLTGWELLPDERQETSHITILSGHIGDQQACLLFWDFVPSVIRRLSGQQLSEMMNRSIGVPEAKPRWRKVQEGIDLEEIRSAFWEVRGEGIHPDTTGTHILDKLDDRRMTELLVSDMPSAAGPEDEIDIEDRLERILTPEQRNASRADETEIETEDLLERTLTPEQGKAFRMHLAGYRQADIATELGISQPRVSQLLKAAIDRLTPHVQA